MASLPELMLVMASQTAQVQVGLLSGRTVRCSLAASQWGVASSALRLNKLTELF